MAIVNLTPDSFSGDGLYHKGQERNNLDGIILKIASLQSAGATIIDIGGESTKPEAKPVQESEEIKRTIAVIEAIHKKFPNLTISIDTYKTNVASEAIKAGASMINDIWAGLKQPSILTLAAKHNVDICIMHNKTTQKTDTTSKSAISYSAAKYDDFLCEVISDITELANNALRAGIKPEKIIVDPGIGFGKTCEQNLILINNFDKIKQLGYRTLLGASRKSFMGRLLDLDADSRLLPTLATTAVAITKGADIIRVHDVEQNAIIAKMTDLILNSKYKNQ